MNYRMVFSMIGRLLLLEAVLLLLPAAWVCRLVKITFARGKK